MNPTGVPLQWQHSDFARCVHAAIAILCGAGLLSSFYLGWTTGTELPTGAGYSGGFSAGWEHLINQPAYFTVLSGLLVFITSMMLAWRTDRTSPVFHAVRLAGVVQVIITGAVFNLLLRSEGTLRGIGLVNDTILHVVVPIVVPVIWLILGPHGRISLKVVAGSMVIPLLWLVFTLLRGPLLDWYPYTILDVPSMGYLGVSGYIGAILLVFVALACLVWVWDRWIWARATSRQAQFA